MNVLIGLAVSADFLFRFIFCFFLSCFVLTKSCSYPFRITIWYLIFGLCWKSVYAWRKHRNFSAPQNNKNNPNFRSTVINCTKFLLILSLRLISVFPFALFFALSFFCQNTFFFKPEAKCASNGNWEDGKNAIFNLLNSEEMSKTTEIPTALEWKGNKHTIQSTLTRFAHTDLIRIDFLFFRLRL